MVLSAEPGAVFLITISRGCPFVLHSPYKALIFAKLQKMGSQPVRKSPRIVKPMAVFESLVVPPQRKSKRKSKRFHPFQSPPPFNGRRKTKKVTLRKLVLKPEIFQVENMNNSKRELFNRKLRLESLLRVLYKFQQFGIPNEKFTMMQLNQKVEEIIEALSRCESKHFLEMTQAKIKTAPARDEVFGEDDVFVDGDGVCIFCKKLPAMCNGDDLYTAIAAGGRRRVKQGLFGEGSVVGRVKRFHQMG